MTKTYTYSETKTRTEAVVDQFDEFLGYTTLNSLWREKILRGVNARWLEAVGVFVLEGRFRVLEAEINIDWQNHSDLALLTPTISTGLPGWENGATPEVRVIGQRFGTRVQELGKEPSFWVRFTSVIRSDPARYLALCNEIGVLYGSHPPPWMDPPQERSVRTLDLCEVGLAMREAT